MRIGLVNRFYPPDPAPTGLAARELAHHLASALPEARITVYASRAAYGPGPAAAPAPGDGAIAVCRRPGRYAGKARLPRLIASLLEGHDLAGQAVRDNDLVIALTDPPLLPLWVDRFAQRAGRPWVEWTMDLYPEFLAAAGAIAADHPAYRWLASRARQLRPRFQICLGPGQLARVQAGRAARPPAVILPSGIVTRPRTPGTGSSPDHPVTLAYAGNYGEAHPPDLLVRLVERADRARFRFQLALQGSRAGLLRRRLADHPAVVWHQHLDEDQLAAAAAHIVCLRASATDLCVPSKAATALGLGCPVVFAGRPEADTWRMLTEAPTPAGWLIPEPADGSWRDPDLDAVLASLADPNQRHARAAAAAALAIGLAERRQRTFDQIADWLRRTLNDRSGEAE